MLLIPRIINNGNSTEWSIIQGVRARTHWANFCLFCEKICHLFSEASVPGDFWIYQILSRLSKLQRCRRPASEQDKFLSGMKSVRFVISIFGRSISVRSPPKFNLYLRGNQTINMDDSYLSMLQKQANKRQSMTRLSRRKRGIW